MPLVYLPLEQQVEGEAPEGFVSGAIRGGTPWRGMNPNQPFFSMGTAGYAAGDIALAGLATKALVPLLVGLGVSVPIALPIAIVIASAALGAKSAIGAEPEDMLVNAGLGALIPSLPSLFRYARSLTPGAQRAAAAARTAAGEAATAAERRGVAESSDMMREAFVMSRGLPAGRQPIGLLPRGEAIIMQPPRGVSGEAPGWLRPPAAAGESLVEPMVAPPAGMRAWLDTERQKLNQLYELRKRVQAQAGGSVRPLAKYPIRPERDPSNALARIDREMERRWSRVKAVNAAYESGRAGVPTPADIPVKESLGGTSLSSILQAGEVTLEELKVENLKSVATLRGKLSIAFQATHGVDETTAAALSDRILARLGSGRQRKEYVSALTRAAQGLRVEEDPNKVWLVLMRAFGEAETLGGKTGGRQYAQAAKSSDLATLKAAESAFSGVTMGELATAWSSGALDPRDVARLFARFQNVRGAVIGRVGENVGGELMPPLTRFTDSMLKDIAGGRLGQWANADVSNFKPLLAEYIKTRAPSKLVMGLSRENIEGNLSQALGVPLGTLQITTSKLSDDMVRGALSVYESSLGAGAPPAYARDLTAQALGVRSVTKLLLPSVAEAAQELAWAKAAAEGSPGPVLARAIAKNLDADWLDIYAFADNTAMGLFSTDEVLLVMANRLNLPTASIMDKVGREALASYYAQISKLVPEDPFVKSVVRQSIKSKLTPSTMALESLRELTVDDLIRNPKTGESTQLWGRRTAGKPTATSRQIAREIFGETEGGETFVRPLLEEVEPRGAMRPFEETKVYPKYVEVVEKLEPIAPSLVQEMDEAFFGDWINAARDPRTPKRLGAYIRRINDILDSEGMTPGQKAMGVARLVRGLKKLARAKVSAEKPITSEGLPGRRVEVKPGRVRELGAKAPAVSSEKELRVPAGSKRMSSEEAFGDIPFQEVDVSPARQKLLKEEGKFVPEWMRRRQLRQQNEAGLAKAQAESLKDLGLAGKAISQNMRDMLWEKFSAGDVTEAGASSRVLTIAKAIKDRGGLGSRAQFEQFLDDYGRAIPKNMREAQILVRKHLRGVTD